MHNNKSNFKLRILRLNVYLHDLAMQTNSYKNIFNYYRYVIARHLASKYITQCA